MQDQSAEITWRDGDVPVSTRFDDPYFSLDDGLAETRHVFLAGNDLPARFQPGFHVAELGFGTGLTLLALWDAWSVAGIPDVLRFTSFEAFPMQRADFARAAQAFPDMQGRRDALVAAWNGKGGRITLPGLEAEIVAGDARETLPRWHGQADAWCLDGFAPARNPEMWAPDLMQAVGMHTAIGGTFATYTAAGHVRRALQDAGFDVARFPGFGRKRHMTKGVRRP